MLIVTLTALILYAAVVPSTLWKTKMKTFHPPKLVYLVCA